MLSNGKDSILPIESRDDGYSGYTPKTPADFEHVEIPMNNAELNEQPGQTIQHAGTHTWLTDKKISLIIFGLSLAFFVAAVSISIFGLECKLGLCQRLDRSSTPNVGFLFKTFTLVAPLKYVWAAFSVSVLGIAIAGLYLVLLGLQKRGINELLADFAAIIRLGLRTFFIVQLKYYLATTLPLFILTGTLHSWRSAGCFVVGTIVTCLIQYVANAIAARGAPRTTAAAQDSIKACLETALRIGSIIAISVLSLAAGGITISYLVFQDIRALIGYLLGVSAVSLFSRMSTGMYKKASTVEHEHRSEGVTNDLDNDARNPFFAANTVGKLASNGAGVATDILASHSVAVIATAVLGASLPYFYDNPYALCVFNHLFIDMTCVAHESPTVKASLAASICRRDSFYAAYESLKMNESNSLFVGLPFILSFIGILTTSVSCLWFLVPGADATDSESKLKFLRSMTKRHLLYTIATLVLSLACTSAVCWVLFGKNSAFGVANSQQFQIYDLEPLSQENAATRCRPLEAQEGTGKTDLPELSLTTGPYRPINIFGKKFPVASQVSWRLFVCFLLGSLVGVPLGISSAYFSSPNTTLLRRVASCGDAGAISLIFEALGVSMLAAAIHVIMIAGVFGISHNLFGAYGIGIAAVGLVSSVGTALAFQMVKTIADAASDESQALLGRISTEARTELATSFGLSAFSSVTGVLSACMFLSLLALVGVLFEDAGFIPSPRQLVGSSIIKPSRHITDYSRVSIIELYTMTSSMLGILLPWLFAGTLLQSGNHVGRAAIRNFREYMERAQISSTDIVARHVPGLKSHYLRFMKMSSSSGVIETIVPGVFAVLTPLIIGFGFGRQALLGFVVANLASSFLLSVTMYSVAGVLESVRKYYQSDVFPKPFRTSPEQGDAAKVGEGFGKGLGDCCAPSLNALPKVVTSLGIVAAQKMPSNLQRGWIGIVLLVGTVIGIALVVFWARRKKQRESNDQDSASGKYERTEEAPAVLDPRYVSPFYESGPRVELAVPNHRTEY